MIFLRVIAIQFKSTHHKDINHDKNNFVVWNGSTMDVKTDVHKMN